MPAGAFPWGLMVFGWLNVALGVVGVVVPGLPTKIAVAAMMTGSFTLLSVFVAESWVLPGLMAAVMVPAGLYACTRASSIPQP